MPSDQPKPRRKRIKLQLSVGLIVLVAVIATAWYLRSSSFENFVRGRVIAAIERATGGRTEIGSFTWSKFEFVASDVTIHGREGPNQIPFAHFDRVDVHAKLFSLLFNELDLTYLQLDRPVIHLITYPDGTTNQPRPTNAGNSSSSVQELVDLAIDRVEIHGGKLLINDDTVPIDLSTASLRLVMSYAPAQQQYDGSLDIGKLDLKYQNFQPITASAHAEFTLLPRELQLKKVTLSSGDTNVEATGKLVNFSDPQITISYKGALNIAQAGMTAQVPELRGGTAKLAGDATYHAGSVRSTGTVEIEHGAFRNRLVGVSDLNAKAKFVATNAGIEVTDMTGSALGGTFEGKAAVITAGMGEKRTARAHAKAPPQGTAELHFRGLDVAKIEHAVKRWQLPARGTAAGSVTARWSGTPTNADAKLDISIAPPAQTKSGELPLAAKLQGEYHARNRTLDVFQLQLSSPGVHVQAAGSLGTNPTGLHVAVNSSNFQELQSALDMLGVDTDWPVEVFGNASFTGTVMGSLQSPRVAGHATINNFDYLPRVQPALLPGTNPKEVSRVHWDRLATDVQYTPAQLSIQNGVLNQGESQISASGQLTLTDGKLTSTSPLNLRITVHNGDVTRLQPFAGWSYPVSGVVNGSFRLAGTMNNPSGGGTLRLTNATVYKQPFALTANLQLQNHELQASNLDATQLDAHVTGFAAYSLQNQSFRLNLRGGTFDLGRVPHLQSKRVTVAGRATFTAQGSGTLSAPTINGNIHVDGLVLNGESIGDVNAQAVTHGDLLQLTADTTAPTAQLALSGTVRLRNDFQSELTVKFPHLDFDPLLRAYLGGRVTGHSLAAGELQISGPLKQPSLLNIIGNFSDFRASVEQINLQNEGPVRFHMANQVFTLDQFHVTGSETDFSASGDVQATGDHRMQLKGDGSINLKLIQTLYPDFTSGGQLTVAITASGPLKRPALFGQVKIADGSISYGDLPNGLANVNGTLAFNQDRLQVQQLTAQSGGGDVTFGGFITYTNGLAFNLTAKANDMRLRYPRGVSALADADLRIQGTPKNSQLSGEITVTRFALTPEFDFGVQLARFKQPPTIGTSTSGLNNLHLDLHVTSAPDLQVSTSLAKVTGDADLHIRGVANRPTILGRINIQEGQIFFNGTKYQMERGDIMFLNPTRIDPILDLEATTRVSGYDISLGFHGPVDRLTVTYRSDPPLPSQDIISLLAFRQCPPSAEFTCSPSPVEQAEYGTASGNPSLADTSTQILGEALGSALSNRTQNLFGINSRLRISPELGAASVNPTARVMLEQQISSDVTVTYITDVSQSYQQVIQVEYNVNKNVSLVAVRDQFGVVSLDIRLSKRKR